MGRGHHEFIDTNQIEWEKPHPNFYIKQLSKDTRTGASSILLLLKKGVKIVEPEAHFAYEEGYIISGKLREGTKGAADEIVFTTGCYFYRPGGIVHGPWEALEDTLSFLTLDRQLINIRNPYMWDCPKCKRRIMWRMRACSHCYTKRPKEAVRYKLLPKAKTFVSARR